MTVHADSVHFPANGAFLGIFRISLYYPYETRFRPEIRTYVQERQLKLK